MADTLEKELIKEICSSGDKTGTIPATTETGSNSLSYADGFPIATATPQSDGGIPPKRTDMNKVLNLLSKNLVFIQNGGSISFDSDIATGIGGYPKKARLLYRDKKYEYNVESLKDNNADEPTEENIFVIPKSVIEITSVLETTSQLPTASEDTTHDVYMCLDTNLIYFTSANHSTTPTTYSWAGYSFNHTTLFTKDEEEYWIYDTDNSQYVNANTVYSWVKKTDVPYIPMPSYSSNSGSYTTDVEHTADSNLFVIVNLQAQDKTTPAQFLIGASAGATANVELASWSINGASGRENWFIPVPKGYKWKVVKGNITTVTIKVYTIN